MKIRKVTSKAEIAKFTGKMRILPTYHNALSYTVIYPYMPMIMPGHSSK